MDYKNLLQKAKEACKNAYAPYSKFSTGACVLTAKGNTYSGCNIENASYGLTICAERVAISNAVSNGEKDILAIAVYSPEMENCTPCGSCRQVIFEFQKDKDIDIITELNGECKISTINSILPDGFKLKNVHN